MAQWLTLDATIHAEAGWQKFSDFSFAARDHVVLLVMEEVAHALPWYPLAFVFNEQADRYHLTALLSLQSGRNVYLSSAGKWQAPYVPSQYRGYPFGIDASGELCIDIESGLFYDPAGLEAQPLFSDGEPSELSARIKQFHEKRRQAMALTQKLVDEVHQAGLITPWAIRWQPKDKPQTLKGYCAIDEERLRSLPAETYAQLAHSGALGLAYAQIFSRPRIGDLQTRHGHHPPPDGKAPTPQRHLHSVDSGDSIGNLFGEDDDELQF